MTSQKAIVNIVYSPQKDAPHKVYENDKGEIWRSGKRDNSKINVGMGWYSIKNPNPSDSILVVEPYCVLEKDYQPSFVAKFKHIFTWATKAFSNKYLVDKVVQINHPCFHNYPNIDSISGNWKLWDKRQNEIVFVANNKSSRHHSELYSLRVQLADLLHGKSKYNVSWYGQIPLKKPYYKGMADDKQKILGNAKFSICTENSYDHIYTHGYFTEKMPEVWFSGAIPIYMGCHNIDDFKFPDHSYIDLRNYVKKQGKHFIIQDEALIRRIEDFDKAKYEEWKVRVKNNILKKPTLKETTSFVKTYDIIIDTLHTELNTE
jgi:hypothetical protein